MNTRRYPRSLEQAFGPYARGPIEPMREQREPLSRRIADWALYAAALLAIIVIVGVS